MVYFLILCCLLVRTLFNIFELTHVSLGQFYNDTVTAARPFR